MSSQFSQDPEEQLPDWLKALRDRRGDGPIPEELSSEEPANSQEKDEGEEGASGVEEDQEEGELEWLSEIRERHLEDSAIEEETAPAEGRLVEPEQSAVQREAEEEADKPSESLGVDSGQVAEAGQEKDTMDLGELLAKPPSKEILDEPEAEAPSSQADPIPLEKDGLAQGKIPSWLEKLRPKDSRAPESQAPVHSEPPPQEAVAKGEDTKEEELEEPEPLADLSGLMSTEADIGEIENKVEPTPVVEPVEEEDPLAGLSGVLPAERDIGQSSRSRRVRERLRVTRNQQIHRVTLEKMLASEGKVREQSSPEAVGSAAGLRWLITGALFLAILLPLIRDSRDASRPSLDAFPESAAVHELIEALPPSAAVLVGFELQPALYGELEVVAGVVLNHLLEKQAQLIFISTQPTGPALANRLMKEELFADAQYLNLGYLSGSTAALRQFASRPREASPGSGLWNDPSVSSISSISDFALILVISSDAEDARAWLEQVAPYSANGLVIATSAQAAPLLFPYLQGEAAALRGLVGGFSGAVYYEKLRGEDGLAGNYWDAYSYGLGVIVVVLLIAALYGRFSPAEAVRALRRKEKEESAS